MAKKKETVIEQSFINEALDDIMSNRFGAYSKYIIQERALPDARDGLKPVQRRILYSMYDENNTFDKPYRKSAKTVGSVMGTFHPHGDSSIYEAMVRMSQDWKINLPLIDMHGNNGSIDDDPPAAMRYTEARLSKNANYLLEDIDKNSVAMTNNYDDTTLEPTVLPARYPLLLVNGSTGIASGYATNIAPHNLNEVVNATIYRLANPECTLDELMSFVKGPDFPTGGIVMGKESIKDVFKTGKGKVILRSKCEIVEAKNMQQIVITEIPYEVIKINLVKRISDIYLNKDIDGIMAVRDESGRDGLKIVVDVKKDANARMILNYLYKHTDLQINYSYNNTAIVNHSPKTMNLADMLDAFIEHRKEVVLNRSIFLRDKKARELHVIEGLMKAVSILDEVINIIRHSKDKKDSKDNLIKSFNFTDEQAEAIVNLRLYRLSNTDIKILKEDFKRLTKEINELDSIIQSKDVLIALLIKELKEINETIVTPRKTVIEDEIEDIVIDRMSMVPNETCYISLSHDGYLKRFSKRVFDANLASLPYTKDGDYLIGVKKCETLDTLLIFTTRGHYAYVPVYKIDECKFKEVGKHVSQYVKMEGQEKIVAAIDVKRFDTFAFVLTLSRNGMIKKTLLSRFNVDRANKSFVAMKLREDDELVSALLAYQGDEAVVVSKDGRYNKYSVDILSDLATKALGVGAINVKDDECAGLAVNHGDGNDILLTSEKGGFKRIHFAELNVTNRNTKGERLFKQAKTNPQKLLCIKNVSSYNTLIFKNEEKLNVSAVPFMAVDASFSNPLKNADMDYHFINDNMNDIEEALVVEIPEGYLNDSVNESEIDLFADEKLI